MKKVVFGTIMILALFVLAPLAFAHVFGDSGQENCSIQRELGGRCEPKIVSENEKGGFQIVPGLKDSKNTILPVETWIEIGEERQVFNKNTGAGIVRRYYIDPSQHNGVGSTMSVFYKDGSEEMFWKGWNLYTKGARYALKFDGEYLIQPRLGPATYNMITLNALVDQLGKDGIDFGLKFRGFNVCLMDENDKVYFTEKLGPVCYYIDLWRSSVKK